MSRLSLFLSILPFLIAAQTHTPVEMRNAILERGNRVNRIQIEVKGSYSDLSPSETEDLKIKRPPNPTPAELEEENLRMASDQDDLAETLGNEAWNPHPPRQDEKRDEKRNEKKAQKPTSAPSLK